MTASPNAALLKSVMNRFNDDYFIHALGAYGFFCMPNFVFRVRNSVLEIQLLEHVSATDETAIRQRLEGLAYTILPERLTLESIEDQSGYHFPNVDEV